MSSVTNAGITYILGTMFAMLASPVVLKKIIFFHALTETYFGKKNSERFLLVVAHQKVSIKLVHM